MYVFGIGIGKYSAQCVFETHIIGLGSYILILDIITCGESFVMGEL